MIILLALLAVVMPCSLVGCTALQAIQRESFLDGKLVIMLDGDIWTMNANGSNLTQLTDTTEWELDPTWSPDGTKIAFTRERGSSSASASASADADAFPQRPDLFVMNADGSNQTKLLERNAMEPGWSPDGNRIAFSSVEWMEHDTGAVEAQIYVTNADGSGTPKRLTTDDPNAREERRRPVWLPDGNKIAFVSEGGGIYVINALGQEDGVNRARPLPNAAGSLSPRPWFPDGTEIVFVGYDANYTPDIFKLNVSTLKKTRLTESPGEEGPPTWSPDGTKIAFPRSGRIYVMNADGSDPTPVSEPTEATEVALDWRPMPTYLQPLAQTGSPFLVSALALAAALMLVVSGVALALVRRGRASN